MIDFDEKPEDLTEQFLQARLDDKGLKLVKALIKKGADINATFGDGSTKLVQSIDYHHEELSEFLIEAGADVNLGNKKGSPLKKACRRSEKVFLALLNKGADPNAFPSIHEVINRGRLEYIKPLLEHGADINMLNNDGKTPIMLMASRGYQHLSDELNEMNTFSSRDSVEVIVNRMVEESKFARILLEMGADVHIKDEMGNGPLFLAANHDQPNILQILVDHLGPLLNKEEAENALIHANYKNNKECATILEHALLNLSAYESLNVSAEAQENQTARTVRSRL